MKAAKYLNEDDMVKKGITILMNELGPVETARFLNISRTKRVESVKRHRQWQDELKIEDFLKEIL